MDENCTQAVASTLKSPERSVVDPVHGQFALPREVWDFVDTRQFQRLRYIKQLGLSSYVKPSASHTRFEHSLGVAHLSRLMVEHLQKTQPELGITAQDVFCVQLAGLCHDLGHGPFSHVWDGHFMAKAKEIRGWKHEVGSQMMFDDMISRNSKLRISPEDVNFVKALIAGDPAAHSHGRAPEKCFLFDIVANHRNGLDVDKFDYLARDCRAIGQNFNVSLHRLISSARVIENQICYNIEEVNQISELCYTRYMMYKEVYTHETTRAVEHMIVDALLEAEPYLRLAKQVESPQEYIFLTDDIIQRVERSANPELEESRQLIHRVHSRDLYRIVGHDSFAWKDTGTCCAHITPAAILQAAQDAEAPASGSGDLPAVEDIIVDVVKLHFGMKDQNPLDLINFYSRESLSHCRHLHTEEAPTFLPFFGNIIVRIYVKDRRYEEIVRAGYNTVLRRLNVPALSESVSFPLTDDTPSSVTPSTEDTVPVDSSPPPDTPSTMDEPTPPKSFRRPSFNAMWSHISVDFIRGIIQIFRKKK